MPHLRVQLGFTNAPELVLIETAEEVAANLYDQAAYPDPPVTKVALETAQGAFSDAIGAQKEGGPAATALKNAKRDELADLLRQLAAYVQDHCGNDLATLLASGFDAVSTNRASAPLAAPTIRDILNANSAQLLLRVTPIANARIYEVRYAALGQGGAPGPWQNGGLFTNSRSMPVNGLTPGTNYLFQVRAVGGSTGYSDWSDSVSHMSL